jgi:hypothetical protein
LFQKILRIYSYLFQIALSVGCLGLAAVSKYTATPLAMDNLPWKGEEATNWLLGLGVTGLVATAAAASGSRFRFLLPVYSVAQLYILVKGNFFSAHTFEGAPDFQRMIAAAGSSVLATLSSLLQFKKPSA